MENDRINTFFESIKDISQEEFDRRFDIPKNNKADSFYAEKRYLNGLEHIAEQVDNQSYNDKWTDEIDNIFDFVYSNGLEISLGDISFVNDENYLYVKHENKYYELIELYGQGCYQSIAPTDEVPLYYVDFEDIVRYYETGKKPLNVNMMELVRRGLAAVEAVNGGNHIVDINNEKVSLNDVYEYVLERMIKETM